MTINGGQRRPNASRIYDYLLGGKDNHAEDRQAADRLLVIVPAARTAAWENRYFLARATRFLGTEAGIGQFIGIGTGLPAAGNVHQVAYKLEPLARVVYVDNDPVVVSHAQALLCTAPGICATRSDLRDPPGILDHQDSRIQVNLGEPVAILLGSMLHFIRDEENPYRLVNIFKAAVAPGGHLVVSHVTGEGVGHAAIEQVRELYDQPTAPLVPRSGSGIARFFDGFQLVAPGLGNVATWRATRRLAGPGRTVFAGGTGSTL